MIEALDTHKVSVAIQKNHANEISIKKLEDSLDDLLNNITPKKFETMSSSL